jgi:hypothetical protein
MSVALPLVGVLILLLALFGFLIERGQLVLSRIESPRRRPLVDRFLQAINRRLFLWRPVLYLLGEVDDIAHVLVALVDLYLCTHDRQIGTVECFVN